MRNKFDRTLSFAIAQRNLEGMFLCETSTIDSAPAHPRVTADACHISKDERTCAVFFGTLVARCTLKRPFSVPKVF
jgi:hypothetical protein